MKPRVDFYVVSNPEPGAGVLRTACRLAEIAWTNGHRVIVLGGSDGEIRQLDELMWTFRQDAFVPHIQVHGDPDSSPDAMQTPIWLCTESLPTHVEGVLVNLTDGVPERFTEFQRVAEIIDRGSDAARETGRQRFRYYRSQECEVHSHDL